MRRPSTLTISDPSGLAGVADAYSESAYAGAAAADQESNYASELRKMLARLGARKPVPKGASLFDPSDSARHLYIVESGTIDVSLPEDPRRRPVASFHPGAGFLFDLGGHHIAAFEAAVDSTVIDLPVGHLRKLCRHEKELRLLLRQSHAFDLKSFLDVCYPVRSRIRLAHGAGTRPTGCDDALVNGSKRRPKANGRSARTAPVGRGSRDEDS